MNKRVQAKIQIIASLIIFILFISIIDNSFKSLRFDLTENKIYTLSDGTSKIINKVSDPINLKLYFSNTVTKDDSYLRTYSKRVIEFLQSYTYKSNDNIKLEVIDPIPFSDEEDLAMKYGLQAVPLNNSQDSIFFGLVAENSYGDYEIIKFFDPSKESQIEYEVTKLIYSLINIKKPKIGVISSTPIFGAYDFTRNEPTPPWAIVQRLQTLFDLELVDQKTKSLDSYNALIIFHPKKLEKIREQQILQFYNSGKNIMLFYDVYSESDIDFRDPSQPPKNGGIQSSDFSELLNALGIQINTNQVLIDKELALPVTSQQSQQPIKHAAIIKFDKNSFNLDNDITKSLSLVTSAFSGSIEQLSKDTTITPLITSSNNSNLEERNTFRYLPDPQVLISNFKSSNKKHVFSAIVERNKGKAIVVADSDIASNYLWVRVQEFYGEQVLSPWANNGDFIVNSIDYLTGGNSLAGISGRSISLKSFTKVDDLRQESEQKFKNKELALQKKLKELQDKLKIKSDSSLDDENTINEYENFEEEFLKVRKELRNVRMSLNEDIDNLDSLLKFINIFLIPIILTILLLVFSFFKKRRAG